MTLEISSFAEVSARISQNRLRQFPGAIKGRDRLLPYARPQFKAPAIGADTTVFVMGACLGRSIERELRAAGRTVLSSPTDLGLPGSTAEQFQRYNIFNLDVGLNELHWALEGDDAGIAAALMPVGDHLVDKQLSWAFAHDPDTARSFRRIYNGSYRAVVDAEVVILLPSGLEQWFDTETGLYINTMPGSMAERQTPGRFQLHRLGTNEAAQTLTNIMDLVRRHSRTRPLFVLAMSPVSQPMVYGHDDALIDQFLVKCAQRLAIEQVVRDNNDAFYFPVLEAAMWSDFAHTYMPNSPNHVGGNFSARMVSDLLAAGGADDLPFLRHRALSHGTALLAGGSTQAVIDLCAPLTGNDDDGDSEIDEPEEEGATPVGRIGLALIKLHIRALMAAHRRDEGYHLALQHIRAGRHVSPLLLMMPSLGVGVASSDERDELVGLARAHGLDPAALEAMRLTANTDGGPMDDLRALDQVRKAEDWHTTVRLARDLLDRPDMLTDHLRARVTMPLIVGLLRLDRVPEAIEVALDALRTPMIEDRGVVATAVRAIAMGGGDATTEALRLLERRVDENVLLPLRRKLSRLSARS